MGPLQIPNLPTLDMYPSWLNLKGGIDRSACIEIKLSEVRRLAGCVRLRRSHRGGAWRETGETWPLPNETPARRRFAGGAMRLVAGAFEVTAKMLHDLHATRKPRRLAGDLRTARANVMRPEVTNHSSTIQDHSPELSDPNFAASAPGHKRKSKFRHRVTRAEPVAWSPDRNLSPNPNAGATRTKRIGLPHDWSQIIRIEKWHFPKRIQPAYFLVCPGHASNSRPANQEKVAIESDLHVARHSAPSVLPPLSTRPPGREDPSTKRCPQRCLKLMMVQCTEAEYRDAKLAQLWINSIPPQLVPKYREQINRLTQRYGLLFQPRRLLCPRCLKVKYGNNPEAVRQGWRRRNNKPDTTLAGNAAKVKVPLNHWTRYELAFARSKITGLPLGTPEMSSDEIDAWHAQQKAIKAERKKQRRREYMREYHRRKKAAASEHDLLKSLESLLELPEPESLDFFKATQCGLSMLHQLHEVLEPGSAGADARTAAAAKSSWPKKQRGRSSKSRRKDQT